MNYEAALPQALRPGTPAPSHPDGNDTPTAFNIDLRALYALLRRNLKILFLCLVLSLVGGFVVTVLLTPKFRAVARLQIDQQVDRVIEDSDVEPAAAFQDADRFLQTQIDVLTSRAMTIRVAQALNLIGNPRFFEAMNREPPASDGTVSLAARRNATLNLLADNMTVTLPRQSRVVSVTFESPDARLAAQVANSYAQQFIAANLQRKFDSSAYARDFLSRQLVEAKARLEQSERALNAYARQAGLIRTFAAGSEPGTQNGSSSVTSSSLVQLNSVANDARAARIAAQERWRAAASAPLLSIPEVLSNPAIQTLIQQQAALTGALRLEQSKHLPDHPSVRQLQAQSTELDGQLKQLAGNLRASIREEFRAAQDRENSLIREVDSSKAATLSEQDRSVRYNILLREADTSRTLYDGLLQRFKTVSAGAGVGSNNISIVDQAEPPMAPSSPNLFFNLLVALLLGIAAAAAVIAIRERLDDVIRAPDDVERKLGLSLLGAVPVVRGEGSITDALERPRSPVSEAYNALRTALVYARADGLPRSLLLTSTQASEGKSTTAYAVALALARLGKRVVLLDIDLRRPSLHRILGTSNARGISDLLVGRQSLDEVLIPTKEPTLSFIACGPIVPSPTELLGSARMQEVLAELTQRFDVVLLDSAPVLGLADAPLLSSLTEATIFVLEANRGHRGASKAAIRRLRSARANILGAVLTKFDHKRSGGAYGYYGYDYYRYGDDDSARS